MDILSLRLFLRVAELQAVSSAARDLSLSPASASARLAKLEATLGFRLFNRTTRAVTLSTDGASFLPYAQQLIETLDTGLSEISGQGATAKGVLRMAMPGSFARMHVIPALAQFQQKYPLVQLDLRLSDEIINAVEGAFDLIIRNAPLADSSLVARRLATDQRILIASPTYLERYGIPSKPEDLKHHKGVHLGNNNRWRFANGEIITVPRTAIINDGEGQRLLIEQGMGIGVKSYWNASASLKDGRLQRVLAEFPLITESSIWAIYPSGRIVAPKVRAMLDFLLERFQPTPPW